MAIIGSPKKKIPPPVILRFRTSHSTPRAGILITEILETILLHTDMCTLLTSAQRVCHYWHDLIEKSNSLQAHIFFKPVKYEVSCDSKRIRNPLLDDNVWPFLQKQYDARERLYAHDNGRNPRGRAKEDKRYYRKSASWKRMLLQQPPTSNIGIIE
jgi:hypothetical protein